MSEITEIKELQGLGDASVGQIEKSFLPFMQQVEQWSIKAHSLVVTSIDQKEEMKQAREARLSVSKIRIAADKKRKELKEESIRYGKAVQGVYNTIAHKLIPIEQHLKEQEEFAKRIEEEKKRELLEKRQAELSPFSEFVPFGLSLDTIEETEYQKILNGARLQYDKKVEAQELERLRLQKEQEEQERQREEQRVENERLRKEAEVAKLEMEKQNAIILRQKEEAEKTQKEVEKAQREAEKRAAAERKKLEEAANTERLVKEKALKEIAEKQEAEEARMLAEKARLEALAKDAIFQKRSKIINWVNSLNELELDEFIKARNL